MENSDTVSDALLDAAASSTFEDHDNGFGELIRFRCSTNSFHERSGCSWSIAPPPRRSRPNHVRRIDEKHYPSLTDPALEVTRLANATTELERHTFSERAGSVHHHKFQVVAERFSNAAKGDSPDRDTAGFQPSNSRLSTAQALG
jgi:hypothetical protein